MEGDVSGDGAGIGQRMERGWVKEGVGMEWGWRGDGAGDGAGNGTEDEQGWNGNYAGDGVGMEQG